MGLLDKLNPKKDGEDDKPKTGAEDVAAAGGGEIIADPAYTGVYRPLSSEEGERPPEETGTTDAGLGIDPGDAGGPGDAGEAGGVGDAGGSGN